MTRVSFSLLWKAIAQTPPHPYSYPSPPLQLPPTPTGKILPCLSSAQQHLTNKLNTEQLLDPKVLESPKTKSFVIYDYLRLEFWKLQNVADEQWTRKIARKY